MGYRLATSIKVSDLVKELGLEFYGDDHYINEVSTLSSAGNGSLVFSQCFSSLESHLVSVVVMPPGANDSSQKSTHIVSDRPRFDFIRALNYIVDNVGFTTYDHAPEVHPTAKIGKNVVIENGCVVGENSVIEHNVVLHAGTRIGKNTRIRSCSSIGGDGFGFERLEDGTPLRFPHLGGVVIGNNVELGALNSVARGTLSDTIISDFVKTDNLVHIAHNCHVGKGAFITACAELSGGVRVGENAWIGPNSSFMQKVVIGERSVIGLGAVVTKSVPAFTVYAGNPAKKIRDIS